MAIRGHYLCIQYFGTRLCLALFGVLNPGAVPIPTKHINILTQTNDYEYSFRDPIAFRMGCAAEKCIYDWSVPNLQGCFGARG